MVNNVVEDYGKEGSYIVEQISKIHRHERTQLMQQHEQNQAEYISICKQAHKKVGSHAKDLQAVNLGRISMDSFGDLTLSRLRRIQEML